MTATVDSTYMTKVKIDGVEYTAQCLVESPDSASLPAVLYSTRWVQDIILLDSKGKRADRLMSHLTDEEWQNLFIQVEMEISQCGT